jgi:hypothetical protein
MLQSSPKKLPIVMRPRASAANARNKRLLTRQHRRCAGRATRLRLYPRAGPQREVIARPAVEPHIGAVLPGDNPKSVITNTSESRFSARTDMSGWQSHRSIGRTELERVGRRHLLQPPPGFLCSASGTVPSGSPDFSLASILARSSGSGFRSRACDHWNRASSSRPTRQ